MKNRSERLSTGLKAAATRYDTIDRQGREELQGDVHPR
jgi:hypothetical protein